MEKLRQNIVTTLQQQGQKTGQYITPWTITLRILRHRTNCKYYARLRHLRAKAKQQGRNKAEVDRLSVLDVLTKAEMQLYWYIVKEYVNRH